MAHPPALLSPHHSRLLLLSPSNPRPLRFLQISALACGYRVSVAPALQSPGAGGAGSRKGVARATNNIDPFGSWGDGFPLPNLPIWARLTLGATALLALPFYKKILRIEDELQKDAEIVAEVVEKVAEVTEKIAGDVADAVPGDGKLKQAALQVERIADEVDKDAEQVEAILHKVDEMKEEIETMLKPDVEKQEIKKIESQVKEETSQTTDSSKTGELKTMKPNVEKVEIKEIESQVKVETSQTSDSSKIT